MALKTYEVTITLEYSVSAVGSSAAEAMAVQRLLTGWGAETVRSAYAFEAKADVAPADPVAAVADHDDCPF